MQKPIPDRNKKTLRAAKPSNPAILTSVSAVTMYPPANTKAITTKVPIKNPDAMKTGLNTLKMSAFHPAFSESW